MHLQINPPMNIDHGPRSHPHEIDQLNNRPPQLQRQHQRNESSDNAPLAPPPHLPGSPQPKQHERNRLPPRQQAGSAHLRLRAGVTLHPGTPLADSEGVYGDFQSAQV